MRVGEDFSTHFSADKLRGRVWGIAMQRSRNFGKVKTVYLFKSVFVAYNPVQIKSEKFKCYNVCESFRRHIFERHFKMLCGKLFSLFLDFFLFCNPTCRGSI